jgi:pimeloyl-ACP methyl ester carboxylesterase
VDVIAHSMGTMVTRQFLLSGQNTARVHKVALLAPPNLGTPHGAYGAMAGVDLTTAFFGINQTVGRYILQTFPGALDQAPSAAYYSVYHNQDQQHPVPFADLTRTPSGRDYTALRQAETASGVYPSAIAAAESFHASDLSWPQSLASTDISLFSGTGSCTPGQVQLKTRSRLPFGRRTQYYDFGEVDGDDTVSVGSSSMDGGRAGGGSLPVYYRHATHTEMGDSPDVLADALKVVQGSTSVDHGSPGTAVRCKSVSVHSPMEMMLTDPSGKRVGGLGADDSFMEAPHSSFWRFGDMKVGTVDPTSPFTATLHGTALGDSMIKVRTWGASGLGDETVFAHVPTTPSTTGSFTFDGAAVSALRVDVLGDGSQVRLIQPVLLTGAALNDVTPPTIAIPTPAAGQAVVGSFPLSWSAADPESGVTRSLAVVDLACGSEDDTSDRCEASRRSALIRPATVTLPAGRHTVDVWAEDRVANLATAHRDFVADGFAWQPPLAPGFSGTAGLPIPVRFTVATPEGAFAGDQSVLVDLVDSSGQPVTPAIAFGADPARNVAIQDNQYRANLPTNGVVPGAYSVRVRFSSPSLTGTTLLRVNLA